MTNWFIVPLSIKINYQMEKGNKKEDETKRMKEYLLDEFSVVVRDEPIVEDTHAFVSPEPHKSI